MAHYAHLVRTSYSDTLAAAKAMQTAVAAFTDHGWRWGGAWRNPVDYQHFEIG